MQAWLASEIDELSWTLSETDGESSWNFRKKVNDKILNGVLFDNRKSVQLIEAVT